MFKYVASILAFAAVAHAHNSDCCKDLSKVECAACMVGQTPEVYCSIPFNAEEPACRNMPAAIVKCGANQYFEKCHSSNCWETSCDESVNGPTTDDTACNTDCRTGCRCKDGFFRHGDDCVDKNMCEFFVQHSGDTIGGQLQGGKGEQPGLMATAMSMPASATPTNFLGSFPGVQTGPGAVQFLSLNK